MKEMIKLTENMVLIEILESDRDAKFEGVIKNKKTGKKHKLVKDVKAGFGTDRSYEQSLNSGHIVAVADNASEIYRVGDRVIFNSMLDSNPDLIFEQDERAKIIAVFGQHTYHKEDWYIPPNAKTMGGWAWRKGEINDMSHIYCVIRDGEIIMLNGMTLCEHQWEKNKHTETGIFYTVHTDRENVVTRKVLHTHEQSVLSVGEWAGLWQGFFVTEEIDGKKYDCFSEDDIMFHIKS